MRKNMVTLAIFVQIFFGYGLYGGFRFHVCSDLVASDIYPSSRVSEASLDIMKDLLEGIRFFIIVFAPRPSLHIYSPPLGWVDVEAGTGGLDKRGPLGCCLS